MQAGIPAMISSSGKIFYKSHWHALELSGSSVEWDGMSVPMQVACQAVQEVEAQNEGSETRNDLCLTVTSML
jgi:hypothetical protein